MTVFIVGVIVGLPLGAFLMYLLLAGMAVPPR